jgi:hypothetical protein
MYGSFTRILLKKMCEWQICLFKNNVIFQVVDTIFKTWPIVTPSNLNLFVVVNCFMFFVVFQKIEPIFSWALFFLTFFLVACDLFWFETISWNFQQFWFYNYSLMIYFLNRHFLIIFQFFVECLCNWSWIF